MIAEYFNNFPDYPKDKAMLQEYIWHMHRERKTKRVSHEEILREALGKPLFGTAHGSLTTVSRVQEAVLRLLFRWFAVDELKATLTSRGAEFNDQGYRKSSYPEACRCIRGLKESTWRWCISKFKQARIIQSYQDPKRGEVWGAWWLRLNPCRIIQCIDRVTDKRSHNRPCKEGNSHGPAKGLSGWTRFSSSTADSQPAAPITAVDSSGGCPSASRKKKKNKSGDGVARPCSNSSQNTKPVTDSESPIPVTPASLAPENGRLAICEASVSDTNAIPAESSTGIARVIPVSDKADNSSRTVPVPPHSETPVCASVSVADAEAPPPYKPRQPDPRMEEVIRVLSTVYPEVLDLNESDYRKVYRLVTNPIPTVRLDAEMARDLVKFKEDPAGNQILGQRIIEVEVFVGLIPEWYDVTRRILKERLEYHNLACFNDALDIPNRAARILDPDIERRIDWVLTQNGYESPGPSDDYGLMPDADFAYARQLACLLMRGIKTKVTEMLAVKARNYLMQRPSFYVPLWKKCPEVKELCKIPDSIHRKLLKQLEDRKNEILVWRRIAEHYGEFE